MVVQGLNWEPSWLTERKLRRWMDVVYTCIYFCNLYCCSEWMNNQLFRTVNLYLPLMHMVSCVFVSISCEDRQDERQKTFFHIFLTQKKPLWLLRSDWSFALSAVTLISLLVILWFDYNGATEALQLHKRGVYRGCFQSCVCLWLSCGFNFFLSPSTQLTDNQPQ